MGMSTILCALSPKRRAMLEEDPSLLDELLSVRYQRKVTGLLELDKTWDALDQLLSSGGKESVLGDAVMARTGAKMRARAGFDRASLLEKARVAEVATALAVLPEDLVAQRYDELFGKEVHGGFGQARAATSDTKWLREEVDEARASEIEILGRAFAELRTFYADAAKAKHDVMSVIV